MINAKISAIKILQNYHFRKKGKMKLLSADDLREFINQRKPTTPEELKEALTIKDLGVEISPEEAETIREYVYLKNPTVPDAIKKFMANEEEGGKIGLEQAQVIREYVEEGIKDMKKDK